MKLENLRLAPTPLNKVTRPNEAWVLDTALLDLSGRPFVMLVADVATRRPLSATLILLSIEDVVATLQRLVERSGSPEQVWRDHGFRHDRSPLFRDWADQRGISLVNSPVRTKSIAERMLCDLYAFLRDQRPSTAKALGDDIERWPRSYRPDVSALPRIDQ